MVLKKGSLFSANSDSVWLRLSAAEGCHDGSADWRSEPVVLPVQSRRAHSDGPSSAPAQSGRDAGLVTGYLRYVVVHCAPHHWRLRHNSDDILVVSGTTDQKDVLDGGGGEKGHSRHRLGRSLHFTRNPLSSNDVECI
jgi:hypothetical protein